MNPSGIEAYRLGRSFDVMPIPMDPAHCVDVPAGPLIFVVESRHLTDEAISSNAVERGRPDATYDSGIDDEGACVHVLSAGDRSEHLRFDCFDNEPHYHYIRQADQQNVVVRFDQFAEGDARDWTLGRLRSRLPHMLGFLGLTELADAVQATDLEPAVAEVERLLSR
ncbi:hypothetical protein ABIC73_003084 [Prescottella equi]|uniref:DUF7700 domain-containing protein n=1 Tax=Rhodococcus hoagii TaxID=43767 RepID=UPI003390AEBB